MVQSTKSMNKFVTTTTNNPSINLALEEKFFNDKNFDVIVYLWQNKDTIVIGNNQSSFLECNIPSCRRDSVKIVRRMTGGGAVFHDLGNLNFTFIFNLSQHRIEEFLDIIIASLHNLGIDGIQSQRNDLVIDNKKFSGHAYYCEDDRFLFHGTLLINSDLSRLGKYLTPSITKLKNKGINSVRKRVINLSEIVNISIPEVMKEIYSETKKRFPEIHEEAYDNSFHCNLSEKYDDLKLLETQNPDSSLRLDIKTKLGNFSLIITTKENLIDHMEIYSDALVRLDYTGFINKFLNTAYNETLLREEFIKIFG